MMICGWRKELRERLSVSGTCVSGVSVRGMRECECERAWSEGQLRESVGGVFVRGAAAALFTTRRQTTRQDTAGQDWTRHDATRREMSRPDPTRPDSTRPDTTRHDTTRHGTA